MKTLPAWAKADDDKLRTIEAEMLRLQQRIDAWRAAWNGPESGTFPRERGAVRRATMDLTRALSDYRRRRER